MAKSSTVNLSVVVSGDGVTLSYAPPTAPLVNTNAPYGGPLPQTLSSGANTITPPATAQGVLIVPPAGSTVVKTLKGIAGDTGVLLSNALPTLISLPVGGSSFVINAASGETITLLWL